MITKKGNLPFGVEYEGKTHRDFELRPQFVRDTVDIFEDPEQATRAERNGQYYAACLFAGRLTKLGEIPKEAITAELILDLQQEDYDEIVDAGARLKTTLDTFREKNKALAEDGAGPAQGRV